MTATLRLPAGGTRHVYGDIVIQRIAVRSTTTDATMPVLAIARLRHTHATVNARRGLSASRDTRKRCPESLICNCAARYSARVDVVAR